MRCSSCRCCWTLLANTALLQSVSAAKVVKQVCGSVGGDDGQTFPVLSTISSLAAALTFHLSLHAAGSVIVESNTRQRCGATKHDTVTWLAVRVSLPTLLGYQRVSAFVHATKLALQLLVSSEEEKQVIERFIERIFYWYWLRVYRDTYRYRFIAQPYFIPWMCIPQISINCKTLSSQYGTSFLKNASSSLLDQCHQELRKFWWRKGVKHCISRVFLIIL